MVKLAPLPPRPRAPAAADPDEAPAALGPPAPAADPDSASESPSTAPPVPAPLGGGARLYVAALLGAIVLQTVLGFASVEPLAAGLPDREAAASSAAASAWRAVFALPSTFPLGVVWMAPFAYTLVMSTTELVRCSVLVGGSTCLGAALVIALAPAERSTWRGRGLRLASAVFSLLGFLLPLWFVRGRALRAGDGAAPSTVPFMRLVYLCLAGADFLLSVVFAFTGASSLVLLLYLAVALAVAVAALVRDANITHSVHYIAVLGVAIRVLPITTWGIASLVLEGLDQSKPLESFLTVTAVSGYIYVFFQLQGAFAARALPPEHRTIALFPIQVFEDVFVELFVVNTQVYSGGFFVLVALQVVRTLVRDTGGLDEARRMCRNAWRTWHGREPVAQASDAVVDWARIWLQNLVSELSAIFVFVGAIAGEEARGDALGTVTGLPHGERVVLIGGYAVVLVAELVAHALCFAILRRRVVLEQARLAASPVAGSDARKTIQTMRLQQMSLAGEAHKLVARHGLYLGASLVTAGTSALWFTRTFRLDWSW